MVERDGERTLHGIVQMDDAYWGGERHGSASAGRGTPGKAPFVAAIECTPTGEPVRMRMDVLSGFRKVAL
ncbi:MAG: IS1595 family transposase, partial [Terriglobales bacterium]